MDVLKGDHLGDTENLSAAGDCQKASKGALATQLPRSLPAVLKIVANLVSGSWQVLSHILRAESPLQKSL